MTDNNPIRDEPLGDCWIVVCGDYHLVAKDKQGALNAAARMHFINIDVFNAPKVELFSATRRSWKVQALLDDDADDAKYSVVITGFTSSSKIHVIKACRAVSLLPTSPYNNQQLGLKEAKELVDTVGFEEEKRVVIKNVTMTMADEAVKILRAAGAVAVVEKL